MRILVFVLLVVVGGSAYAAERELKLVPLSEINGPTCKHVEIRDANTNELLRIVTEDELTKPEPPEEDPIKIVKDKISESGAKTLDEMKIAVEVISAEPV